MTQTLYERYFSHNEELQEELRLAEKQAAQQANLRSVIGHEGWKIFKSRLKSIYEAAEPRAGSENEMLYQIAWRAGVRKVFDLMEVIERNAMEEISDG